MRRLRRMKRERATI
ncbi:MULTISPECIES: hypothetical protein [Caulobacter]|nr:MULTISPECIES: hypothetical protein [Caulobacter]YP_002515784.2 hypothetical protein CCNA_00409 [Caulobacter vibrioides NA1000]MCA0357741.1 hypothetical protein [Pseudomonadota bacterium]MCK5912088.1 hypothetical protein [Caulobacter sp.]ACL93876.2 hypothetical protein CCNA_00409 [Caulobacter vibrioides NA1000]MCY1646457.1 hypothetical protein [Caulobacter sp. SL161]QXZ53907.1 hypothetical protein KZH45_02080 [Caulobacter vibrioides]